jgi:hypothetical protein
MPGRIVVVLSLLVLGLSAAPATAWTPLAGSYQIPPPSAGSVAPDSVSAGGLLGFEVTIHGGRWPYTPPTTPAAAALADPSTTWLALDVSVANWCSVGATDYSAGYFRVRRGDLPGQIVGTNRPVPAGDLQPALGDGTLPASPTPGRDPPRRRGWVTFSDVPNPLAPDNLNLGPFFLDYVTPLDALGDIPLPLPAEPSCSPLRRLSLPLRLLADR